MGNENNKHATVGKTFEIDQRAVKTFLSWLPDGWLARKQDPDIFNDYEVEIVEHGEPTGLCFIAQIKGFEENTNGQKPLSYSFKTKHLKYYLERSQHPVFLFLINVTRREGFWLFAQKHLKEKVTPKILDGQQSVTVHFFTEDNLENSTKFKCLLSEAERYVRDLHPGSIQAAFLKRKAELESKDPRCSVAISIQNGKEHILVSPKEPFSFNLKVHNLNLEDWRNVFERGTKLELPSKGFEIEGAPLLEYLTKLRGDKLAIQFGSCHPASVHFICNQGAVTKTIPVEGQIKVGTKFLSFEGRLSNSPLKVIFEVSLSAIQNADTFQTEIIYSPSNWAGQRILWLSHFDQIKTFTESFSDSRGPTAEIFIYGNSVVSCDLGGESSPMTQKMSYSIDWFGKCRWLANHYQVNPIFPELDKLTKEQMEGVVELFELLSQSKVISPAPFVKAAFVAETIGVENVVHEDVHFLKDGILNFTLLEKNVDFFGASVPVGAISCSLTDMKLAGKNLQADGKMELVFEGSEGTKQTTTLLSL